MTKQLIVCAMAVLLMGADIKPDSLPAKKSGKQRVQGRIDRSRKMEGRPLFEFLLKHITGNRL